MTFHRESPVVSHCPLCRTPAPVLAGKDNRRSFFKCTECALVFVSPRQYLSLEDERANYRHHQNSPLDNGYRTFLKQLFEPVHAQLSGESRGLDFGCGPGPTLHLLFEEVGHSMSIYDPAFFPDEAALCRQYHFITLSEVVEHLHHPADVLCRLWALLHPGGVLGIMTQFLPVEIPVEKWFYKNDETHVCFFSTEPFEYLANQLNAELQISADNVALFIKKTS